MSKLTQSNSWLALTEHYSQIKDVHMRDMFANDEARFDKYSLKLNDILYDFSKNRINDKTVDLLYRLAKEVDVPKWIEKIFDGEKINHTEHRAVLHAALRDNGNKPIILDGVDIRHEIKDERDKVKLLAEKIRTRQWRGATNQAITDIVNNRISGANARMMGIAIHPSALILSDNVTLGLLSPKNWLLFSSNFVIIQKTAN